MTNPNPLRLTKETRGSCYIIVKNSKTEENCNLEYLDNSPLWNHQMMLDSEKQLLMSSQIMSLSIECNFVPFERHLAECIDIFGC